MHNYSQHIIVDQNALNEKPTAAVVHIMENVSDYGLLSLGVSIADRFQGKDQFQISRATETATPPNAVQIRRFVSGTGGNIRAEPNTSSTVVGELTTELEILGSDVEGQSISGDTTWYKVQLLGGGEGYVHKTVTIIIRTEIPLPEYLAPENASIPEAAAYPHLFGSLYSQVEVEVPGIKFPIVIRQWGDFIENPDYNLFVPTEASKQLLAAFYAEYMQALKPNTELLYTLRMDHDAFEVNRRGLSEAEMVIPGTIELVDIKLDQPINLVVVPDLLDLPRKLESQQIADGITGLALFYDGANTFYMFPGNTFQNYATWPGLAPYGVGLVAGSFGKILAHTIDVNNRLDFSKDISKQIFIAFDRTWHRADLALKEYNSDPRFAFLINDRINQISPTYQPVSNATTLITPKLDPK